MGGCLAVLQQRAGDRDAPRRRRVERHVLLRRRARHNIREPVGFFATGAPSPYWQVIAREYVERITHQSQIRHAVAHAGARWRVGDSRHTRDRACALGVATRLRPSTRLDHCDRLRLCRRLDMAPRVRSLVGGRGRGSRTDRAHHRRARADRGGSLAGVSPTTNSLQSSRLAATKRSPRRARRHHPARRSPRCLSEPRRCGLRGQRTRRIRRNS